jgi:DNA repair protein RecN (Recombination protein N)
MLKYISVKNFAIIENIEVEFKKGMTALTGETGAGKSLLIDAIGLLLGDRATTNIVRTGSDKAEVEGIFYVDNPEVLSFLATLDIPVEDNEILIRRQITTSNNNIIKINNRTITLKDLKEITSKLADIHTQQDTHRLINPQTYLEIIDGFEKEKMEKLIATYQAKLAIYKHQLKELERLQRSNTDLLERLDLMKFQANEIESFQLEAEEEDRLQQEVEKMENFDTVFSVLKQTIEMLDANNAIDTIYDASKELKEISEMDPIYQSIMSRLQSSYYELDDVFVTLKEQLSNLDFDPRLLDSHQERLNSLDRLKRKYRKSIEEILAYYEEITKDIDNIEHYDDVILDQKEQTKKAFLEALEEADKITNLRKQISAYIEQELLHILADLELTKTSFQVAFQETKPTHYEERHLFYENGIDEVDFLLTTNVGEPLKSLSKSASGGEMSRIMLGFKNLLTKSLGLSLIIFDEIDTGVSGYVANQVAKKMFEIAQNTQVIAITHIPQVASISNNHLKIRKEVTEGRTKAIIEQLHDEKRVYEIAEMISGDHVTEASLITAKELLNK